MPDLLPLLLHDHTTGRNIIWATHDYEPLGAGYQYADEIQLQCITGQNADLIKPRVLKTQRQQSDRSKDMAEVFTPSWICDAQNNLVDDAMRGNYTENTEGTENTEEPWQEYVQATCLEITCGEAPYLVSRYDATTGEPIPIYQRIGLLDRKLRAVSEHVDDEGEWLQWAQTAYRHTYGYEWQGDNLLLARQNLLCTFIEYFQAKFSKQPSQDAVCHIADIVSWNLWQMDGLTCGIPSYDVQESIEQTLFDDLCPPANRYCRIRDWDSNEDIRFIDMMR